MGRVRRTAALLAAGFVCSFLAYSAGYDAFGGWTQVKGKRTGYFHAERIGGRWWLVSPEGNAFFSKGVCHVNYAPESDHSPPPPADTGAWALRVARQLREWGFNTAGAWSARELDSAGIAYSPVINMAASVQRDVWLKGGAVDYFSREFRETADRIAKAQCAPRADDPWLIGYFTDNELRWGPDWRSKESLLESYLKMPEGSPGFRAAAALLKSRGRSAADLTDEDKDAFLERAAAEYGRVTSEAIRRYDPNHMVLGCRFAGYAPEPVLRALAPYFEVFSYHSYTPKAPREALERLARITSKPTMVTEFSFKAMDSGLPNTKGAAKPVATQQDRADGFAAYVEELAAIPSCVGYHWFEYRDQPAEGRRLDGENSNYGVVKIDGSPWEVLTARMKQVNAVLETLAAQAARR
jgi:hypothetical protein